MCIRDRIYDKLPNPSVIALNVTSLAKMNDEEYCLAVNSNLNMGGLCTLLVAHGCVFDLFLPLLVHRNHARYIPNKNGARSTPKCHGHVGEFETVDS
eukprot:5101606-Pleurochrysis_carterae.AAC.1